MMKFPHARESLARQIAESDKSCYAHNPFEGGYIIGSKEELSKLFGDKFVVDPAAEH